MTASTHNHPIRETQLRHGPLLISHPMPAAQTVSLGIFLNIGSRDETNAQAGMAHALEHMLFKGTRHLNVDALAEQLDQLGGTANAFTARERTCFHMRVLREDWQEALGILCDMVIEPALPADEWQREREVIFSEMAMSEDVPEDWVFDRHVEALYPDQALGRTVLGSRESLSSFKISDFSSFLNAHYRPPHMLIAAAGCITHDEVLHFLEQRDWPLGESITQRNGARMASGLQRLERDDEQGYFVVSMPGISATSEDRPVAWLVNQILGGGMSSRLFREVREKRGLAYGIASHLSGLSDTGAWSISGSTDCDRLGECMRVVRQVMHDFAASMNDAELKRAVRQLEVSLRMGMDSSESNMLHLGTRLDESNIQTQDAWVDAIKCVSLDEARAWAQSMIAAPALWTCSGPASSLDKLPQDLAKDLQA